MEALDRVFELFSRERRRYVLYYLERREGPTPVSEVAEAVQTWESEGGSPESDDVDDELAIALKHRELPKLNEAEFVEYDPDAKEITISGMPAEIKVILSVTKAIEQPRETDVLHL